MKKAGRIFLFTALFVMLFSIPVLANYYPNNGMGISFTLSDSWQQTDDTGSTKVFTHKYGENENMTLISEDVDLISLDELSSEQWKSICDEVHSKSNLEKMIIDLKTGKSLSANVTFDSVPLTSYEIYNNVKYFRYETAFTASSYNFNNAAFYLTTFVTVKPGKCYTFHYLRKTTSNNFNDFTAMLNSMTYEDVIKITVNGERIYPDSDPVIAYERTLVPIRAVAEKMGYTVSWNDEYKVVVMTSQNGAVNLFFGIGDYTALRTYGSTTENISLDVAPVIWAGRTYLPVRAVAEAMNANVNWNQYTKTVEITY